MNLKIYLAAPLFNEAERIYNTQLKQKLEGYFDVYLPQENGDLMVDLIRNGLDEDTAREKIFEQDINSIDNSDIFIIVLDGRVIDEGAAFELGYAFAKGKTCIGFQTDDRQLLPTGNNPMIDVACSNIFNSIDDLLKWSERLNS